MTLNYILCWGSNSWALGSLDYLFITINPSPLWTGEPVNLVANSIFNDDNRCVIYVRVGKNKKYPVPGVSKRMIIFPFYGCIFRIWNFQGSGADFLMFLSTEDKARLIQSKKLDLLWEQIKKIKKRFDNLCKIRLLIR